MFCTLIDWWGFGLLGRDALIILLARYGFLFDPYPETFVLLFLFPSIFSRLPSCFCFICNQIMYVFIGHYVICVVFGVTCIVHRILVRTISYR